MTDAEYLFDNAWRMAYERLAALERDRDHATIRCLETIGVAPGWHCLEIGGGAGSIAAWLCRRVGPTGRVVATDTNTRFLAILDYPCLEVLTHNVITEALPIGAFDLAHTRAVLTHLPERREVLGKIADAVKPGGWLLVEEMDFSTEAIAPDSDADSIRLWTQGMRAVNQVQRQHGMDLAYGLRLYNMVRELGFTSMGNEGQTRMFQGGSPDSEAYRLTMEQLRDSCVATGEISDQDYGDFLALFSNPSCVMRQFLLMSVWGRRASGGC
jgi:SAM-dependent methyltransferase